MSYSDGRGHRDAGRWNGSSQPRKESRPFSSSENGRHFVGQRRNFSFYPTKVDRRDGNRQLSPQRRHHGNACQERHFFTDRAQRNELNRRRERPPQRDKAAAHRSSFQNPERRGWDRRGDAQWQGRFLQKRQGNSKVQSVSPAVFSQFAVSEGRKRTGRSRLSPSGAQRPDVATSDSQSSSESSFLPSLSVLKPAPPRMQAPPRSELNDRRQLKFPPPLKPAPPRTQTPRSESNDRRRLKYPQPLKPAPPRTQAPRSESNDRRQLKDPPPRAQMRSTKLTTIGQVAEPQQCSSLTSDRDEGEGVSTTSSNNPGSEEAAVGSDSTRPARKRPVPTSGHENPPDKKKRSISKPKFKVKTPWGAPDPFDVIDIAESSDEEEASKLVEASTEGPISVARMPLHQQECADSDIVERGTRQTSLSPTLFGQRVVPSVELAVANEENRKMPAKKRTDTRRSHGSSSPAAAASVPRCQSPLGETPPDADSDELLARKLQAEWDRQDEYASMSASRAEVVADISERQERNRRLVEELEERETNSTDSASDSICQEETAEAGTAEAARLPEAETAEAGTAEAASQLEPFLAASDQSEFCNEGALVTCQDYREGPFPAGGSLGAPCYNDEEFRRLFAETERLQVSTLEELESASLFKKSKPRKEDGALSQEKAVYGRATFQFGEYLFNEVFSTMEPSFDMFCDIGHGAGSVVLHCAFTKGTECRGVELCEVRHNCAIALTNAMMELAGKRQQRHGRISLRHGALEDPVNRDYITQCSRLFCNNYNEVLGARANFEGSWTPDHFTAGLFTCLRPGSELVTCEMLPDLPMSLQEARKARSSARLEETEFDSFYDLEIIDLEQGKFQNFLKADTAFKLYKYTKIHAEATFHCTNRRCKYAKSKACIQAFNTIEDGKHRGRLVAQNVCPGCRRRARPPRTTRKNVNYMQYY